MNHTTKISIKIIFSVGIFTSTLLYAATVTDMNLNRDIGIIGKNSWVYCDPRINPHCVGVAKAATGQISLSHTISWSGAAAHFHLQNTKPEWGAALWSIGLSSIPNNKIATEWVVDYFVRIDDPGYAAYALEVDANQGLLPKQNKNYRLVYGTECDLMQSNDWKVFQWQGGILGQGGKGTWIDTGVRCSYLGANNKVLNQHWFHVIMKMARGPINNQAIFEHLWVADVTDRKHPPKVVTNVDMRNRPIPALFPQQVPYKIQGKDGLDVQLDSRKGPDNFDVYIDNLTVHRTY